MLPPHRISIHIYPVLSDLQGIAIPKLELYGYWQGWTHLIGLSLCGTVPDTLSKIQKAPRQASLTLHIAPVFSPLRAHESTTLLHSNFWLLDFLCFMSPLLILSYVTSASASFVCYPLLPLAPFDTFVCTHSVWKPLISPSSFHSTLQLPFSPYWYRFLIHPFFASLLPSSFPSRCFITPLSILSYVTSASTSFVHFPYLVCMAPLLHPAAFDTFVC